MKTIAARIAGVVTKDEADTELARALESKDNLSIALWTNVLTAMAIRDETGEVIRASVLRATGFDLGMP